jgi:hypothetical protein
MEHQIRNLVKMLHALMKLITSKWIVLRAGEVPCGGRDMRLEATQWGAQITSGGLQRQGGRDRGQAARSLGAHSIKSTPSPNLLSPSEIRQASGLRGGSSPAKNTTGTAGTTLSDEIARSFNDIPSPPVEASQPARRTSGMRKPLKRKKMEIELMQI